MTAKNARLDIKTTESTFMIEQNAAIQLNAKEAKSFLRVLESTPVPNKKLKALSIKHNSSK